jgi:hypothetical protein
MHLFFYYIAMCGLFFSQVYYAIKDIKRDKAQDRKVDGILYFQVIWNSLFFLLMAFYVIAEVYTN